MTCVSFGSSISTTRPPFLVIESVKAAKLDAIFVSLCELHARLNLPSIDVGFVSGFYRHAMFASVLRRVEIEAADER